jgi:hypothetical protein
MWRPRPLTLPGATVLERGGGRKTVKYNARSIEKG